MDILRLPRANPEVLHRLTESGGLTLWGLVTPHSLDDVMAPSYFDSFAGGMRRFDRVHATVDCAGATPEHVTLLVEHVERQSRKVTVSILESQVPARRSAA